MRKVICLALILFGGISVFAQDKLITEDEFAAVINNARKQDWRSKPYSYRVTGTYQVTFDGVSKPFKSDKYFIENDKKGGSHWILEINNFSETLKFENIQILGKYFERKDDGTWSQVLKPSKIVGIFVPSSPKNRENIVDPSKFLEKSVEYKYLGSEQINNQTADIYASFENYTTADSSGVKTTSSSIRKYWFGKDGTILKLELKIEVNRNGNISRTHIAQIWEADAHIKIEAPVLPDSK